MSDIRNGVSVSVTSPTGTVWFGTALSKVRVCPDRRFPVVTVAVAGDHLVVPARDVEPWPRIARPSTPVGRVRAGQPTPLAA